MLQTHGTYAGEIKGDADSLTVDGHRIKAYDKK